MYCKYVFTGTNKSSLPGVNSIQDVLCIYATNVGWQDLCVLWKSQLNLIKSTRHWNWVLVEQTLVFESIYIVATLYRRPLIFKFYIRFDQIKELYTGTPNSDISILCTEHSGRNVNKPSAPTEVEGKELRLWCDIKVQQKNKLIYQVRANDFWLSGQYGKYNSNIFLFHPLGPFPSKNDALPLNSLFWSPHTAAYTDLTHQIVRFLVFIFLDFTKL